MHMKNNPLTNQKIFAWRWDIDHLFDLERGVPSILDVARKHKIRCSFYINLGRSVDLVEWLYRSPRKTFAKATSATSINILKKIGAGEILKALFWQRQVGRARPDILKRILAEGHELGVHGIFNHLEWSRRLGELSLEYLDDQMDQTLDFFEKELHFRPIGFTAPGFRYTRDSLLAIDRHFSYSGELFTEEPVAVEIAGKRLAHMQIPVTVCGPDTIPLIEYLAATGKTSAQIAEHVKHEIDARSFAVPYGHPGYEGLQTGLLDEIFDHVLRQGFEVLTLAEIYDRYKSYDLATRTV